jgi:hypothetical protein
MIVAMRWVPGLVVISFATSAHASGDVPGPSFTAFDADVEVSGVTTIDTPNAVPAAEQLVWFGSRVGMIVAEHDVGYHFAADLALGGAFGRHSGLAYDVAVMPFGAGAKLGRNAFVSFGTGLAAMGATGGLDDGVLLPFELEAEAGDGLYHVIARARVSLVLGRADGAPSLPAGDELATLLAVRVRSNDKGGYLFGIAYDELLGARYVGFALGYAISSTE